MNQVEKKYVLKRIEQIAAKKRTEVREFCTTHGIEVSNEEKLKRLLARDFKISEEPIKVGYYNTSWHDHIDFGQTPTKVDQEKQNRLTKLVNDEEIKLKDEVVLGEDHKAILKAIIEFQKKEFK